MGTLVDAPAVVTADTDYPELCVEWLPNQGPFAADGEWCDITAYVQGGSCQTGRQYELERFQSGSLSLTLLSATRLFDPDWSSGPFQPWLVPMRQVRVSAVWNSVRYAVWRGYISDWGQTVTTADNQFVTTIQAKDAFSLFEAMSLPGSWLDVSIRSLRPDHWYPLDETTGSSALDAGYASTLYDATYVGSPTLNNAEVVPYDGSRKAVTLDGTDDYVAVTGGLTSAGTGWSVMVWFTAASAPASQEPLLAGPEGTAGDPMDNEYISITTSGYAKAAVGVSGASTITGATNLCDGAGHMIVVTRPAGASTTITMYVDGTSVGTVSPASATLGYEAIGANPGRLDQPTFTGSIAHVAMWNRTLSAAAVSTLWGAGGTAHTGDDTGTHLERVLDAKNWPDTLRSIDTGASTIGAYELGTSVSDMIARCADTEAGQTYVGPSGEVVHRNRQNLWLDTRSHTSQASFGDVHSAATLKYVAEGFELARDDTRIRNPVSAARSGGITATATDQTLVQEKYGERGWDAPTAYDSTDNVMRDRAAYFLAKYKDLGTRLAAMTVKPRRDPTNLWPQVLGRLIGDRITVLRTPLGLGNEISSEQIIEGISHTFSPRTWTTTYRASPAETTIYFILDDADHGELDDDVLAY